MQTFLPYPDFERTARVLDYRRLGKQRVEAKQILQILLNETQTKGWRNHPAVKMWAGYEGALALYGVYICSEWRRRGYNDSLLPYFQDRLSQDFTGLPPWIGPRKPLHRSHKSNLLRKDFKYYSKYFKNTPDDLPYVWPTHEVTHGTTASI